jgi:hypothetical protein
MLNKTVKIIVIAGILVLSFIGFISTILFFVDGKRNIDQPHGIVVQDSTHPSQHNQQEVAKQLAQIHYSFPTKIYGSPSSIFKVLFAEPRVSELFKRASYSIHSEYDNGIVVNFVFLNQNTQALFLLFSKPTFIQNYSCPATKADSGQSKILYNAVIHDSNGDGIISGDDNAVLLCSDLDGSNLLQLTPDSVSLSRWEFTDHFQSVLIEVKQPLRDKSIEESLWPRHLYWYDFASKKFKYQKLDELLEQSKRILGK